MANISEAFAGLVKSKVFGMTKDENLSSSSSSLSTKQLKIISKNFMSLSAMARDLNVSSQNIKELVRVMGDKPSDKEDKVAGSGLTEEEREKKLQVMVDDLSPKKVEKQKKPSFFEKMKKKGIDKFKKSKIGKKAIDLKKQFSDNKFIKAFKKYFAIAAIIGIIFFAFKDTIIEWANGLFETIKEKFTEFVDNIKQWFDETVTKIVDGLKEFIGGMIETVSKFFGKIGDFFVSYFEIWKSVITTPFKVIAFVYNKFKAFLQSVIDKLPDWLKEKLGLKPKEETQITESRKPVIDKPATDDELKKARENMRKSDDPAVRAAAEKLDKEDRDKKEAADTERVRKQEEKAKYTGEDKIVRERHGIEDKTATMRAEEAKKAQPVPKDALVTSEGKPVVSGSGQVITTTPTETKPTPTPSTAPSKEKKEEKPLEVSGIQATIIDSLKQSGINSPKAHANVLATVKAESNFKVQSENLNYSDPDRIQAVFGKRRIPSIEFAQQFVKNPEALANYVYKTTDGNSEPGDGFKYRGRGFIQHTGKNQYAAISKFTGVDVLKNPDALNSPEVAAKAIPWFLLNYKRMKPEDVGDMSKVNKAIAFADPTGQKALAREKSSEQIYASMSGASGTQVASASSDVASGQRQQQKPSTPVVVNAPTTNTTIVNKTQTAAAPPPKNTTNALMARAT
jgi:putative chitinase